LENPAYPLSINQNLMAPGMIQNLFKLREWESENLPLCFSSIGQSVFRYIAESHLRGYTPSVKELVNDLAAFSRGGIRLQLRKLESEGWIELTNGMSDARNRHISSTRKLDSLLKQYRTQIKKHLPGNVD
jgi:DNA-binding MarR family transcriptional regulator